MSSLNLNVFFSRSRNTLLNGDTKHYDWDSGYTCHQLGSGSILIQLGELVINFRNRSTKSVSCIEGKTDKFCLSLLFTLVNRFVQLESSNRVFQ